MAARETPAEKQFRLRLARFGLTVDEFSALLDAQRDRCSCCGARISGSPRPAIDYDARAGAIRGLLCARCRLICGSAGFDPEELERAARYLRSEPALSL